MAGWGKDAFATGQYQNILKQVDVSVVSLADCQTALRKTRLSGFFNLDSSFMCAGGEAGKDACTVREYKFVLLRVKNKHSYNLKHKMLFKLI